MRDDKNGLLGALPRVRGISKRFLVVLLSAGLLLGFSFILLLNHSNKPKPIGAVENVIDERASADAIQAVIKAPRETPVNKVATPPLDNVDMGVLQSAADAPISAYHSASGMEQGSAPANNAGAASGVSVVGGGQENKYSDNKYMAQNQQSEKLAFLNNAEQEKASYIKSKWEFPVSPYEIKAGAMIPATLQTAINSDLPGTIIAKVRRDVFDTVTGNYLLIPQGATLIGVYDSQVAYGQRRVLIAWERLIFPNGMSQTILGQPGVDLAGQSGLQDQVNNHYARIFGSALMFSLLGAAGQMSQPAASKPDSSPSMQQALYGAIGMQLSQTGAQMAAQNMNIQPTLQIRAGANFNVMLTKDLVLPGPYHS